MIKELKKILFLILFFILFVNSSVFATDTMLMFVGEDQEMLSIASGREEAAWNAPAIADVVVEKELDNPLFNTLNDVLAVKSGFHIEKSNSGSVSYMRGIPESALVLFDTVPMTSGFSRGPGFTGDGIFLPSLKRIEIVRGAGSVLWGADAFAGVVNAVPLTGKDFSGIESGVSIGSGGLFHEVFVNKGTDNGIKNSFLSLGYKSEKRDESDCNVVDFFEGNGVPAPVDRRFGSDNPEDSRSVQIHYNFAQDDKYSYTINLARNEYSYSRADWDDKYVWAEKDSTTSGLVKFETSRKLDLNSGLRYSSYYSKKAIEHEIIDKSVSYGEDSLYGELIYDRECFVSQGLLTLGLSVRYDKYSQVPVWQGYIPRYFDKDNTYLLPSVFKKDFENKLYSGFMQYHHTFGKNQFWIGLRNDAHEEFENKISYNSGVVIPLKNNFILKTIFGNAYRTPTAKQYVINGGEKLEEIKSFNFQVQWKKGEENDVSLTLFKNLIDNHIIADRYEGAGLSTPNSQTLTGMEIDCSLLLTDKLKFQANLTKIFNSGSKEKYLYNEYDYVDDQGNVQKFYIDIFHDYDAGADLTGNLSLEYKVSKNLTLTPSLSYFSKRKLFYFLEKNSRVYDSVVTADFFGEYRLKEDLKFDFYIKNLFDNRYKSVGLSESQDKQGIEAGFGMKINF